MTSIGPNVGIRPPSYIGVPGAGAGPAFPPWLPLIDGTPPTLYADLVSGDYWANGSVQDTLADFLTASNGTQLGPTSFQFQPAGGFSTTAETLYAACSEYDDTQIRGMFSMDDDTPANRIDIRLSQTSLTEAFSVITNANETVTMSPATIDPGLANKCAVSASVASGGIAVVNGGAPATTALTSMPTPLSEFLVGFVAQQQNPFTGTITQFGVWPVAATAAELQTLTG